MAILQISKLQQRTGNLVDLPQLDDGELGWATDAKRLFIGKTTPNENIEVLTTYSNISFSQLNGAAGNLNMNSVTNGQILTYVASTNTWENYTGPGQLNSGKLQLGDIAGISITGAAGIGYVLSTDGVGNLSWTPKGTLQANIQALSNANPIIMTLPHSAGNVIPLVNGAQVTITGVAGANANSIVNGQSFYVTLSTDYDTSGNIKLYTDVGRTTGANGFYLTATANTGVATSVISGGGSGSSAGGANTSVLFNDQNISNGVAGFTFNKNTTTLSVSGPVNASAFSATTSITSPTLISNIATGTAPLTVTSTTRVANLDVAKSGIANTVNDAAQPNITSVGTLTSLAVNGTVIASAVTANTGVFTGNANGLSSLQAANLVGLIQNAQLNGGTYTMNITGSATTSDTVTTAAQPNITSVGTLTSLAVTGTATAATFTGAHTGNGSGLSAITGANVTGTVAYATTANAVAGANVTGAVAYATTANAVAGANVSGAVALATYATTANAVAGANVSGAVALATYATTANAVAGANVSGQVSSAASAGSAATAGTVTTAAQPNITSVGTLTSLAVSGALNSTNITTGANTTAGSITGTWTLSAGSTLQATYADLAEYYESDRNYEPGTVLAFGGTKEVTLAEDGTTRVAGVVSTNPAYAMNANCHGIAVAIALQGRVPTKVRGTVRKGDMMISAGSGFARPWNSPLMGTVIGKALENFDGIEGVIEIAVGRL
jgi:hypothetical protein